FWNGKPENKRTAYIKHIHRPAGCLMQCVYDFTKPTVPPFSKIQTDSAQWLRQHGTGPLTAQGIGISARMARGGRH
ncbi:hypothetical protein, partial [Acetobacter peroxydans]|uniref:hypothetical protein n=1 Tax=Acetobacter peroxydans TaxID=104098 RepID=UPI00223074EA